MADECGLENGPPNSHKGPLDLLTKSVFLSREVHGFLIGGEKRLLFSEVNEELSRRDVQREDIFDKLKALQLQLSEATIEQRSIVASHLGLSDPSPLGKQYLIRQTDAERLCGAVIRSQRLASEGDITEHTFKVQHEIFGKSRGLFIPELYTHSCAECITCIQCRALLSPQDFVRHNHSPPKHQVRHWGLEATRWWRYVFVAKDQENRDFYQRLLDELKQRFSSQCDDVTTLPTTIKTAAAAAAPGINITGSSTTTAAVYSQLAALQDASAQNNSAPDVISQQHRPIYESNGGRYEETANSRPFEGPSSFAELMASAMAVAVKNVTGQALSSMFVPPPNVRLQDMFKTASTTGSENTSKQDDGDEIASKRMRFDGDSSNNNSSPISVTSENNNYMNEALATVAAIASHARLQSESASVLALPAQILLGHSKPLPIANLCSTVDEEPQQDVSNSSEENNSGDSDVSIDSMLRQQLVDEIALLKSAFARQLTDRQKSDEPSSLLDALLESASAEHEVERLFSDNIVDEFCKLRAQHHSEVAKQTHQVVSNSASGMPTPKHMTVMGKYLGELQEAKSDLEARVRALTSELSQAKEEYNSMSLRLVEKERESNEMRHLLNAMLVGSPTSSFFSPATTSAISAAILGHQNSSSAQTSQDQLAAYQFGQQRALMLLMASDKLSRSLGAANTSSCHTHNELGLALNAASNRVLSSST